MSNKRQSPRQQVRLAMVLALIISLGLAAWAWLQRPQISTLPILTLGGDFSLRNATGKDFTLSDSNGQARLLSFGYTHCPDICPLTLARYRAVLAALGDDAAQLQPIMVSVDPARDTPAILQKYVRYFSPQIVGLTGSPEAIAAVAKQYAAYIAVDGNNVSHSDYLYLIDREGRVRRLYDQQADVALIVREVRALIVEPREAAVIRASDAWVREVPPVSPAAALFVRLHNASDAPVVIRAMSSPAAERVEWHDMLMSDGHMRMSERTTIELPPGDSVLAPGGSHLMLMGLRQPLRIGDVVPVTVTLGDGQRLLLKASVRATPTSVR